MKRVIFFISCFFICFNKVSAVSMTCPSLASPGEVITCHIEEDKYIGLKANYEISRDILYQNLIGSNFKKYYYSDNGFSMGRVLEEENSKLEMDLELKVSSKAVLNEEYKVSLVNIEAVDSSYKSIGLEDVVSSIKVVSNDNSLKSLEVKNHKLSPRFDSNVYEYNIKTEEEKIEIKAVKNNKDAKIEGDIGVKKLEYGANTFVISVTSAKGEVREYYLYVTRVPKKSSDITLKSLTLSKGKIDFDKNKFIYTTDVDYSVDEISVEAIPTSDKASVKIDKSDKLEVGKNEITITVTSENGNTGKYVVIVNRLEKLSSDAMIKYLNIKGYNLNFKSDVYEYELEVKEDKLDIEVVLSDKKAKYEIIGNKELKNNSVILIKVVAVDGTICEYKIKISKLDNVIVDKEEDKNNIKDEVMNDSSNEESKPNIDKDEVVDKENEVIEEIDDNSKSIFDKFKLVPLIGFIILVMSVVIVKGIRTNNEFFKKFK